MGAAPQAKEVGPVYDLLLSTRDGQPLTVLNQDRQPVQVSSVAFMTTIDRNQQQHEETELQHKDQLIQLQQNLIDREFDQWPQVTQGDWSGGIEQRVFSGPNADQSRYWDGQGLIWPLTDWVPQQPFLPSPFTDVPGGATNILGGANVVSADLGRLIGAPLSQQAPGAGFAYMYWNGSASVLVFVGGLGFGITSILTFGTKLTLSPVPDVATNQKVLLAGGHQAIWYTMLVGATPTLDYAVQNPSGTLAGVRFDQFPSPAFDLPPQPLATGEAGNRAYVAWCAKYAGGSGIPDSYQIRLYDVTVTNPGFATAFPNNVVTSILLPAGHGYSDMCFVGDNLMISTTDGVESTILVYNIPVGTTSVAARIHDSTAAMMAEVGGGVFIVNLDLAGDFFTQQGGINQGTGQEVVDLYLLQGGSLQHIGPLAQGVYFQGCSKPAAHGPYAIFMAQDSSLQMRIFAYDALRGRLFQVVHTLGPPSWGVAINSVSALTTVPTMNRGTQGGNPAPFTAQWGIVYAGTGAFDSAGGAIQNGAFLQEAYFGVQPQGQNAIIRQGVDVTSSLIDFTSSQPKLYRQLLATFTPLGINPAVTITFNAWLDRDPLDITSQGLAPDFTIGIAGSATNQNVTRLPLPINRIARKIVYQVVITPNGFVQGNQFVSASKLITVAVQSATGWVQTLMLDLAPQVQSNGKNVQDIWTYQGIDSTAAYNFLRQLWRQRGGEVTATFPNGDSGPWLLQDMHFDSPKPYGVSFRADQRSTLKYVAAIKLREDVA